MNIRRKFGKTSMDSFSLDENIAWMKKSVGQMENYNAVTEPCAASCWYEEKWYDEDLWMALREAGVEETEENLSRLKEACLHLFDDKSERNEMLANMARVVVACGERE